MRDCLKYVYELIHVVFPLIAVYGIAFILVA